MSITEELREWAAGNLTPNGLTDMRIRDIADRIDEAHEREVSECKTECIAQGVLNGIEYVGIMSDSELAEHGLVRLPVDADGIPARIGDEVERRDWRGISKGHSEVIGYVVNGCGNWTVRTKSANEPSEFWHYKPTPAERIRGVCDDSDHYNMSDKCRKALRAIADELEGNGE